MYWQMTRTLACGMLSAVAKFSRAPLMPCVEIQTVSLSPSHSHTRAVRLDADVRDDVRRVGLLDRVRRRREAGRQVAGLLRLALAHVAAGEHRRRRARERLLDDGDVRQHFVLRP